ncbi:hypothetical protein L0152_16095 [bacterium]|nr:hypothetical protein [bacterium]
MKENDSLDIGFIAVDSEVAAESFYRPRVITGEMDLSQVRHELRQNRKLSEEQVKTIMRNIGDAQLKHLTETPSRSTNVYFVGIGPVLMVLGIALTIVYYQKGYVVYITLALTFAGVWMWMKPVFRKFLGH